MTRPSVLGLKREVVASAMQRLDPNKVVDQPIISSIKKNIVTSMSGLKQSTGTRAPKRDLEADRWYRTADGDAVDGHTRIMMDMMNGGDGQSAATLASKLEAKMASHDPAGRSRSITGECSSTSTRQASPSNLQARRKSKETRSMHDIANADGGMEFISNDDSLYFKSLFRRTRVKLDEMRHMDDQKRRSTHYCHMFCLQLILPILYLLYLIHKCGQQSFYGAQLCVWVGLVMPGAIERRMRRIGFISDCFAVYDSLNGSREFWQIFPWLCSASLLGAISFYTIWLMNKVFDREPNILWPWLSSVALALVQTWCVQEPLVIYIRSNNALTKGIVRTKSYQTVEKVVIVPFRGLYNALLPQ